MPRRAHPVPDAKHPRSHLREQRSRAIRRNWRRAKERYGTWSELHPEVSRADPTLPGAWWPFTLAAGELVRNPFNHCSCLMCSTRPEHRRLRRRREGAWLRGEVEAQMEVMEPFARSIRRQGAPARLPDEW
jgi:hypothetical protein